MNIEEQIEKYRIIPVVVLDDSKSAAPLAAALIKGGLPIAEITFRTPAAREAIKLMSESYPEMLIGAGSLTNVEQAKQAIEAGAKFLVTAGFNRQIVEFALSNNVPIYPGIATPSELMLLLEYDLKVAKFFPAENFGGIKTLKAMSAPFAMMKFIPTGGINSDNVKDYLAFDKVLACGGSWMVSKALINEGNFAEITKLTKQALELTKLY